MTLVLGEPGSGKSTLLKILSGRFLMTSNIKVEGEVTFSGRKQDELRNKLPQLVSYVGQHDKHYPTLTVKETLEFAHACSGAGLSKNDERHLVRGPPDENQVAMDPAHAMFKNHPDVIIRQLGLENCQHTVMGDAISRGVSGGERKRVTTGEMAFGNKFVLMLDEISTGLDSAMTFDIISTQRSLVKAFSKTAMISLLQPSPEVFELFDDVILLNDGCVLYHGPRVDALGYFETLGFKCPSNRDEADFLLDLGTDRQFQYEVENVPRKACEFKEIFERSEIHARMLEVLHRPLDQSLLDDMNTHIDPIPEFSQGYWKSSSILIQRQWKLIFRDKALLLSRLAMSVGLGLLNASTFYQFDEVDSQLVMGLGYVVASVVTIGQSAQVPAFIAIRDVFKKQRRANFFRTSSFVLAASTSHIPLAAIETVIFGTIMYWMCGFVSTIQSFLVFELLTFLTSMTLGAWFFVVAAICPDLNVASPISVVSDLFFAIYSGFVITKGQIPSYLMWIYWTSPLTWSIRAIAVNQYTDSSFDVCVYRNVDYCEKYGMTMGQYSLSSFDVQTEQYWVWLGIVVLMVLYVFFMVAAWFVLEYWCYESPPNAELGSKSDTVVKDAVFSKEQYLQAETPRNENQAVVCNVNIGIHENESNMKTFVPVTLAFKDLWYSVPDSANSKASIDLLKGVSGFALPGTITALMGSSGAGKTTLMDVIAGRKPDGQVSGEILLNGHAATDLAIRRATGYCEQTDIHSDAWTFREALTFSAFMRQDADIPDDQKYESVNECLDLLDLHPVADKIIRGSSTEQMKRLTIGVELAAQPSVLFLDEPTSGLDARSAKLIMDGVRKVADTDRTIICTIHQPSAVVFSLFDGLLLLKRGGEMAFFGDLGEQGSNLINYFGAVNGVAKLDEDYNPATWMLEVIGAGVGSKSADKTDFVALFKSSKYFRLLNESLSQEGVGRPSPHLPALQFTTKCAASNATQVKLLVKRFFNLYWRTPSYNLTRFIVSLVVGLIFGITFIGSEYSSYQGINSGLGMVYMTTSFMTFITFNAVMPITYRERMSFYRERECQTYSAFWYLVGSSLVEIPFCFAASLIFVAVYFPMAGYSETAAFFAYWLNLTMLFVVQAYFGQLLAYSLPSIEVASVFSVIIGSICTLFTGFNPPAGSIPEGYQWLHHIVPHKRTFASLSAIVFGDCPSHGDNSNFGCQQMSSKPPSLPEGVTVKKYLEMVFEVEHSKIWSNLVIVVGWVVGLRLLALAALRFVNHQKR
uniref:ABC transporter domain-containing protein n=2 Tax=Phytophthora ramorum TaxID=164328 RepID=H3H2P6_PHYRM